MIYKNFKKIDVYTFYFISYSWIDNHVCLKIDLAGFLDEHTLEKSYCKYSW